MNGMNEDFFGCQVPRLFLLSPDEVPTISKREREQETYDNLMERVHNDLKGRITRNGTFSVMPPC